MRTNLFFLLTITVLLSCGSMTSFESPNSLRNMTGTLYLTNGTKIDGKLIVQMGNLFGSDVKIIADGDTKPMHYDLGQVEGYRIRNDYYALKEKRGGLSIGRRMSFMKRLTPENSLIHLYENIDKVTESNRANGNNHTQTRYETEYYLQLPDEQGTNVYALDGSRFVPNFDEKMSRIVSDCPQLAQKIAAKENGYFYAQVSLFKEKRASVVMTIIEEYNRCGKSSN